MIHAVYREDKIYNLRSQQTLIISNYKFKMSLVKKKNQLLKFVNIISKI